MSLFPVKSDINDYFKPEAGDASSILKSCVSKYSADIYLDEAALKSAMAEFGADELLISKVFIMTRISGFRRLQSAKEQSYQADLSFYVMNAQRESGFSRNQLLELAAAMAESLGIRMAYELSDISEPDKAFAVPYGIYEQDLQKTEEAFKNEKVKAEDMQRLEALLHAGIPQAKRIIGTFRLRNLDILGAAPEHALTLLEEAYADGDYQAAAELGDFYYERGKGGDWQKAFDFYTCSGAAALNEERAEAVKALLEHRSYNRRLIIWSAACSLLLLLIVFLMQVPGYRLFVTTTALLFLSLLACAVRRCLTAPFGSFSWLPALLSIVFLTNCALVQLI